MIYCVVLFVRINVSNVKIFDNRRESYKKWRKRGLTSLLLAPEISSFKLTDKCILLLTEH